MRARWMLCGLLAALSTGLQATPLAIVASIQPLGLLAQDIAGDRAEVTVLLSPGTSPHHFALRPSQRARLEQASIVFWAGPALERPLASLLPGHARATIALLPAETGRESHAWLDPARARDAARRLADALVQLDPAGKTYYEARFGAFEQALKAEQDRLAALLAPWQQAPLLLDHDFLDAFWPAFGLRPPLAIRPHPEQPPGSGHLMALATTLQAAGTACYLREDGAPPDALLASVSRGVVLHEETVRILQADVPSFPAYLGGLGDTVAHCLEQAALVAGKKKP